MYCNHQRSRHTHTQNIMTMFPFFFPLRQRGGLRELLIMKKKTKKKNGWILIGTDEFQIKYLDSTIGGSPGCPKIIDVFHFNLGHVYRYIVSWNIG